MFLNYVLKITFYIDLKTSIDSIDLSTCWKDKGKYLLGLHHAKFFIKCVEYPYSFFLEEFQFSISTIHCAQGGEYDHVVLYLETPISLNLMYTAMTRAKKSFKCIGKGSLVITNDVRNVIKKQDIGLF